MIFIVVVVIVDVFLIAIVDDCRLVGVSVIAWTGLDLKHVFHAEVLLLLPLLTWLLLLFFFCVCFFVVIIIVVFAVVVYALVFLFACLLASLFWHLSNSFSSCPAVAFLCCWFNSAASCRCYYCGLLLLLLWLSVLVLSLL